MLGNSLLDTLQEGLRKHGFLCDTFEVSTNHYLPVPAGMDWASYPVRSARAGYAIPINAAWRSSAAKRVSASRSARR